jgi:AcrR family transcriptional regulator
MDGDLRALSGAESTRVRLLSAARETFAAVGFEAAGTRLIAARAGVRQGLVRHHFGSKTGLFEAVLEAAAHQLEGDLDAFQPLTVDAVLTLLTRHTALARLAAHALLAGGEPGRAVRARLEPLLERLEALQREARGAAPDGALRARMWLASAFVACAAARDAAQPRGAGDTLFAWLCAGPPSAAAGPFSIAAARARLRG